MEVNAVAESDTLAGGNGQIAGTGGFLLKIVETEWIRGEKPVISHVPRSRMARILRMVEDGNADRFLIHRSIVITPLGCLPPRLVIADTGALDDVAFARLIFAMNQTH